VAGEIARVCKGNLLCGRPDTTFDAISTDSRDIRKNDLFVPLKGANFDGHEFLFPALEAGARGALTDRDITREIPQELSNYVLIQVQDTLLALSDLASAHRISHPTPLIAVTGSSGKTTVKEMIAAVLGRSHHLLVSQGNLNNMIGLPMTVLNLGFEHTVAVVEAGINQPGEMDHLARAASPDVAVITTVGPVHLEGLGSVENIAHEKFKLVKALRSGGIAVLPADNPFLAPLFGEAAGRIITFGMDQGDFRASNVTLGDETLFEMIAPEGKRAIRLKMAGRHNVNNALAAAAAALAVGVSLDDVAEGLSELVPLTWRMEILPLPGNRTLIRDCYNANPQSMRAALEVLVRKSPCTPTLAILGDMAELGEQADRLHQDVGREAARLGISRLIFVGNYGRSVSDGFVSEGGDERFVTSVPDKEAAWDIISDDINEFTTILVKGSRVMKMELIADRILEEN
jgi:UDP-N-acetylmuramoyl-tripeptide--D-alanyl-D-alanine ligase